jgi:hypothetical protein
MTPDQFVVLIQMLNAIRCQIGAVGAGIDMPEMRERAEFLAERSLDRAQHMASLPQQGPAP